MAERPSLLDNQSDPTAHGEALVYLARDLDTRHDLSVATGYVNLSGLHHLAAAVNDGTRNTRLLLGAAPGAGLGKEFPVALFERTLLALRRERNLSRFPPSRALRRLLQIEDWLAHPGVEVRRYVKKFLHGKTYLFGNSEDARAALVTSANLTAAGMWQNLELGLVHYDPVVAQRAVAWFDLLWNDAADFKEDLRELLFPHVELIDPRTVYLRALLELFGDDIEDDPGAPPAAVNLAPFQEDGFRRALGIVKRHRGVVYADGVGTGKTEIGLAFVEEYAVRRGQHVLIVVPAQLVDYWKERLNQSRLSAQVVSYHRFAADEQIARPGTASQRALSNDKDAYRLVIFDEAHTLRNPDTIWYSAMSRLLGGNEKDLLMLTATPINNGLWDLYHLVMAFARHDAAFAARGISSLSNLFRKAGANERDPENLNPDVLFPLADMVSVRRDRRFIEQRYPGAVFPDGTPVSFPFPLLTTQRYDLDRAYPGLVAEITTRVRALTMARYRPSRYRRDENEMPREAVLSALLQSAILKRFESCWHACLLTIRRLVTSHNAFLMAWDAGYVPGPDKLRNAANAELDETGMAQWVAAELEEEGVAEPVADFLPEFRRDVEHDRELLCEIEVRLGGLDAGDDPKLALLSNLLEESPAKKVVVFTTFADTIEYLEEHLPAVVAGRERITVIGAKTSAPERLKMLSRFCPETVVRPGYKPPGGEVDLLLSNDVLAEGQNLQQAAAVVSYDIPWNPQRMVQRYGRVIRLKSPHDKVYLTTMLPEPGDLEDILKLEVAIRRKIIAARPYGMEVQVVDDAVTQMQSYAKRLAESDATLLDEAEQAQARYEYSAEALRAELKRELEEGRGDELQKLPWGIGSAFRQAPGVPSGGAPGVFFACRAGGERYWRYVDVGGMIREPSAILRRINPGGAPGVAAPGIDLEESWKKAVASIVEEHNAGAGQGPLTDSVGKVQRWALDLLGDPSVSMPRGGEEAYQVLSVGRSQSARRELGKVRRRCEGGSITKLEAASEIVAVVRAFGLRPVEQEPDREPITENDVGVVCWMGVLGGE